VSGAQGHGRKQTWKRVFITSDTERQQEIEIFFLKFILEDGEKQGKCYVDRIYTRLDNRR